MNNEINNLNKLNDSDNLSIREKRDNFYNYIKEIKEFLVNEESLGYSDKELNKLFQYKVKSKTKEVSINGEILNMRIIEIDGGNIFGTLKNKWIILQQWNDNDIYVQDLITGGAEILNDFIIIDQENPILILISYNMALKEKGVSICTWDFMDDTWIKNYLEFNYDIDLKGWELNNFENCLDINTIDYSALSILINEKSNEFKVIAGGSEQKLYMIFKNGKLLLKNNK